MDAAVGRLMTALDGASFRSIFEGKPIPRKVPLSWYYFRSIGKPKAALVAGDWKLLGHWDGPQLGPGGSLHRGDSRLIKTSRLVEFELYNLRTDLAERNERSADEANRRRQLSVQLQQWHRNLQAEAPDWEFPPRK